MRIKKTFQTTVPTGKVLNNYTESNVDTYSCDYINGLETYSTDETRVGTWIDGKPIYRKVINFGKLPNNNVKNVNHNIENMETIIDLHGVFKDSTYQIKIPSGGDYNSAIRATNTQIGISTPQNLTAFSGYIILEYTKTTD